MNSPWHIIINPAAGNGSAFKKWGTVQGEMDRLGLPYTFSISTHKGHVIELARTAMTNGATHFISMGGDGTHHELINGLLAAKMHSVTPVVAILNAGTGNDWSRHHKIPTDIHHWMSMIAKGKTTSHAAGLITYTVGDETRQQYFMNVAGMALDGRVVEKFPKVLKRMRFLPGYLIAGVKQLIVYRAPELFIASGINPDAPGINPEALQQSKEGRFLTVHAGICKYSGGGMQFVPQAEHTVNTLAVTCIRHMPLPRLLANIYRLYTGTILSHPKAEDLTCTQLKVTSPTGEQVPIEADGEFLGYTPVSISIVPNAFRMVTK